MRVLRILAGFVFAAVLGMDAGAQAAKHAALKLKDLQTIVARGGLDVVAIEPGSVMVSDGRGFPARLSLAGCDQDGACRVVRIYTRYVIGGSEKGMAAANLFSLNFPAATLILAMTAGEPAVDVGRDASLEDGRTQSEILGEIAAAMSDARLLHQKLMEADPLLKATLGS